MKRKGENLEEAPVEKKRIRGVDSTRDTEKRQQNTKLFNEIVTHGRKIMPVNIIKYKGYTSLLTNRKKWITVFNEKDKHIPRRSHATREDAEIHIKLMNDYHGLLVRNIVYEHDNKFYCVLTKGQIMKFAFCNLDIVEKYIWHALYDPSVDSYYACTLIGKAPIKFHSLVCPGAIKKVLSVDHINRITLDNEPANLRLVGPSIQALNQKVSILNTSGVKGVHHDTTRNLFVASWSVDKQRYHERFYYGKSSKQEAFEKAVAFRQNKENTLPQYIEAFCK